MPQTAQQSNVALSSANLPAPLRLDASGALSTVKTAGGVRATPIVDAQGNVNVNVGGTASALNVTASTAVKATPGKLVRISVLVAGAAGAVHDCATTGAAADANKVAVIPAAVGIYELDWPCLIGITYVPGAAQVVSITYQ